MWLLLFQARKPIWVDARRQLHVLIWSSNFARFFFFLTVSVKHLRKMFRLTLLYISTLWKSRLCFVINLCSGSFTLFFMTVLFYCYLLQENSGHDVMLPILPSSTLLIFSFPHPLTFCEQLFELPTFFSLNRIRTVQCVNSGRLWLVLCIC